MSLYMTSGLRFSSDVLETLLVSSKVATQQSQYVQESAAGEEEFCKKYLEQRGRKVSPHRSC